VERGGEKRGSEKRESENIHNSSQVVPQQMKRYLQERKESSGR
jgi:hypothetical protein